MSQRDSLTLSRPLTRSDLPQLLLDNLSLRILVFPEEANAARTLLNEAYAQGQGSVLSTEVWLAALMSDTEYDPDLCLGAFDRASGDLVGVIQAWNTGFIKDLGIRPTCRRSGVGRALVEAVCARLTARGIQRVSLKVIADNQKALRFYSALGFKHD